MKIGPTYVINQHVLICLPKSIQKPDKIAFGAKSEFVQIGWLYFLKSSLVDWASVMCQGLYILSLGNRNEHFWHPVSLIGTWAHNQTITTQVWDLMEVA